MSLWREPMPRQQRVATLVAFLFVVSAGLDLVSSERLTAPWWSTLGLGAVPLVLLHVGRRSRHYKTLLDSLRAEDVPRFERLMALMPPLIAASILVRLALGDSIITRVMGWPIQLGSSGLLVLAAGTRKTDEKRELFVPWPFKLPPRVPPDNADK